MGIATLITVVTVIIGTAVSVKALVSKPELEQVFYTHEQKIKAYYYKLLVLSGVIAFLVGDLYILFKITIKRENVDTADWSFAIALALIIFICCLATLGTIVRIIRNFFIKYHFKYKVKFDTKSEEVYILRMMNDEICICSKDPNSDLVNNDSESIFIKLEDIINKPIIKEKIEKPNMKFWQKIIE